MPWRMVRRGRSAANTQWPHDRSRHLPDEDTKLAMVSFVKAKSANLLTKLGEFAFAMLTFGLSVLADRH